MTRYNQRDRCRNCKHYIRRKYRGKIAEWCDWENKKLEWIKFYSECYKYSPLKVEVKKKKKKRRKLETYKAEDTANIIGIAPSTLRAWSKKLQLLTKYRYRYPAGYGAEIKTRVWNEIDIKKLKKYKESR